MRAFFARLLGRGEPAISEARPADAAAFSALHAECFRRGWSEGEMEQLLLDPGVVAHRAAVHGHLAGFILSRRAADEAEILSVAVEPRRRGRGLARAMLDLHLRSLAGMGTLTVFLEVDESNSPARRLYARAGFESVGIRESYYTTADGGHSSALVLRRAL